MGREREECTEEHGLKRTTPYSRQGPQDDRCRRRATIRVGRRVLGDQWGGQGQEVEGEGHVIFQVIGRPEASEQPL